MNIKLLSIDLSNYCSKQCPFCYNHSTREGNIMWSPQEVISFAQDCIRNGVEAISLGGGEPFEYEGVFDVINALQPEAYLSVTSNGLPLGKLISWDELAKHRPDKIHLSLHNPQSEEELERVIHQMEKIREIGIKPGCNLLVSSNTIEDSRRAYERLCEVINEEQIIVIPQRFSKTPNPKELSYVAGGRPFQSPSCILGCKRPEGFASVSWNKMVNSCSYAPGKQPLESLDFKGMMDALNKINFKSCINNEN